MISNITQTLNLLHGKKLFSFKAHLTLKLVKLRVKDEEKDRRLLLLKCRKFEGPFSLANFTISPALYKEKSLLLTQLNSGTLGPDWITRIIKMTHYHSDRQAVPCPRPPPPRPPDFRAHPLTHAQCPKPASLSNFSY